MIHRSRREPIASLEAGIAFRPDPNTDIAASSLHVPEASPLTFPRPETPLSALQNIESATHIPGDDQGALQRMLILVDIEEIMRSAGMGLAAQMLQ